MERVSCHPTYNIIKLPGNNDCVFNWTLPVSNIKYINSILAVIYVNKQVSETD